jgi:hypothetical protein
MPTQQMSEPTIQNAFAQIEALAGSLAKTFREARESEEKQDAQRAKAESRKDNELSWDTEHCARVRIKELMEVFLTHAFVHDLVVMRDVLDTFKTQTGKDQGNPNGLLLAFGRMLQKDDGEAIVCTTKEAKILRSLLEAIRGQHWTERFLEIFASKYEEVGTKIPDDYVSRAFKTALDSHNDERSTAKEFIERYGRGALEAK